MSQYAEEYIYIPSGSCVYIYETDTQSVLRKPVFKLCF